MTAERRVTVLVADDHPLFRDGIAGRSAAGRS